MAISQAANARSAIKEIYAAMGQWKQEGCFAQNVTRSLMV